ncbi:MAG: divergent polysaccharide deacetylase family protein [Treponema sp.]|nr:divergent polysaccharide deacetylase family protein [Treponema sp.]
MKKSTAKKKTAVPLKSSSKRNSPRRKKKGLSVGIQGFLLAGLIVVSATAISLTIISIHSAVTKKPSFLQIVEKPKIDKEQKKTNVVEIPDVQHQPLVPDEPKVQPQSPVSGDQSVRSSQPPVSGTKPPSSENKTLSPQPPVTSTPSKITTPSRPPENTSVTATNVQPKPVENKGTVVFVIDDAGNNLRELDPFLKIEGPLTIAVLPGLPYSAEAARRIRAAGKEVILHQPMEAIGGQDPGPGAINSGMSAEEIRAVLARNIAEVGPVTGMNNHQGSKITMDREAMSVILAFCKENKIYYLDSRTTADTVVPSVAQQMNMKIAQRNVFIDNEQNKPAMLRYITGGLTGAQRSGLSVMIGHTWSPDLAPLLKEQYPLLIEQGYTIKTAHDVVK